MQSIQRVASPWVSSPLKTPQGSGSGGATCPQRWSSWTLVGFGRQTLTTTEVQTMTEAITNLQRLLVKSYVLSAPFINRKAFPIGYHGAQVLRYDAITDVVDGIVARHPLLLQEIRSGALALGK